MVRKKGHFIYDLEVYPNFFSAKFKNADTGERYTFVLFADLIDDTFSINNGASLIDFIEKTVAWLIGYNNHEYDDIFIADVMTHASRLRNSHPRKFCEEMYALNSDLFKFQREGKRPPQVYALRNVPKTYKSLDLIQIYNPIDRVSLKQLAIGLRWPKIMDLPYKPGSKITRDQVPFILEYQDNDVDITEAVKDHKAEDINNRIAYTKRFNVDVVNSSNSAIGKLLLASKYSEATGQSFDSFKDSQTNYSSLRLIDCISPKIHFQTPEFKRILAKTQQAAIDPNKKEKKIAGKKVRPQFLEILRTKYLTHNMMLGGVHSNNASEILQENSRYIYKDIDVQGYYPRIWCEEGLFPAHLDPIITKILEDEILNPRGKIKKSDPVLAYMLKIGANAAFGLTDVKGDAKSWLKDPRVAKYITISGQLFLFMLMEAIETYSNCIVVYSNTDGLTVRIPREEEGKFDQICARWELYTGFTLEKVYYKKMIIRDVNNYLMFTSSSDPKERMKAKGAYKWDRDIHESFVNPIIAIAVREWFDKGISVDETILNWKGVKKGCPVYDFMCSQGTDPKKFNLVLYPFNGVREPDVLQKTNRWIVTKGNPMEGRLIRVDKITAEKTEMQKGCFVTIVNNVDESTPIENYNIDYDYYINEAMKLIQVTKESNKETHVPEMFQPELFT